MQHYPICSRTFEFGNTTGNFNLLLQEMLLFIKTRLPAPPDAENVLFRSKYVLTELLTNAIKHSGAGVSTFGINIFNDCLTLIKADQGEPLHILKQNEHTFPQRRLIAADAMHQLFAELKNANEVQFVSVENNSDMDFDDIQALMEHFGLLIISKSSASFSYSYNPQSLINRFEVVILY